MHGRAGAGHQLTGAADPAVCKTGDDCLACVARLEVEAAALVGLALARAHEAVRRGDWLEILHRDCVVHADVVKEDACEEDERDVLVTLIDLETAPEKGILNERTDSVSDVHERTIGETVLTPS